MDGAFPQSLQCTPAAPQQQLKKWENDILDEGENVDVVLDEVWKLAYRTGADQELEACVKWLRDEMLAPDEWCIGLRAIRRPLLKLKKLALSELNLTADSDGAELSRSQVELIRLALEQLPDQSL